MRKENVFFEITIKPNDEGYNDLKKILTKLTKGRGQLLIND